MSGVLLQYYIYNNCCQTKIFKQKQKHWKYIVHPEP